ncbi:hypothetical protein GE09DRAFT_592631 [Coniochaeta sp. 2T2.1]|nr:hypothetical protein GE09DRAFT_592631 [Coniochaeta sp. 2T2.1]
MLHSRGRHPMDYFAVQDMSLQRASFLQHFERHTTDFDNGYFMVISWKGVTYIDDNEDTYGQLVHIDDRKVSDKLLGDKLIIYAATGVVLLEIQERLYRFLLHLVVDLLTDNTTTLEHLFANEHKRLNPGMESGASPELQVVWLADERDEAPYTGIKAQYFTTENQLAQRRFNQLIVETKWKETLDHWRLLRHDPGYLKEAMYRLQDVGKTLCIEADLFPSEHAIWLQTVSLCVREAFKRMHTWDEISRLMTFLNHGELGSRRCDGKESTPECTIRELALPFLYDHLRSCLQACIENFTFTLKWKAHVKEWQYHQAHEDAGEERSEIRYFKWLVGLLADDEKRADVAPHTIMREMDYLVSSSPRALKAPSAVQLMLSEAVNDTLADLATWTGVWEDVFSSGHDKGLDVEINTAKLANRLELDRLEKLDQERAWGPDGPNPPELSRYRGPENFRQSPEAVRLGMPADGRFDYPIDKAARTMQEEKRIRQATRAMHRFWEESDKELVRERVFRHFGNTDVFKSPEMVDDPGQEAVVFDRPDGIYHDTLGIRLDVDEKSLRVFRTMFVLAGTDGWDPQPVSWKEFQHAMLEAGYKMFCRYVGAWLVVPPCSQEPARSDQCHIFRQPRAGEKLSVAALRRFGLRIRWTVKGRLVFSHFRLRAKKGKKDGKGTEEATVEETGEDTDDESEPETDTEPDVWTAYPLLAKAKPNPDFSRHSRC